MLKDTVKRREMSWLAARAGRLGRWSALKRGLALVYHRVADVSGSEERELVPAIATRTFEWQIRHLAANYRLVTASDLPAVALARRRGEPFPVAITFDDDYLSHRRAAMPVLLRNGIPATFFLCGASLKRPFSFWWEALQRASDLGIPPGSIVSETDASSDSIHDVAAAIQTMKREDRVAVAARLQRRLGAGSSEGGMSASDVRALVEAGFEIGFHTLEHHPLTTLGDGELPAAMTNGRDRIASLAGQELATIAYPHGRADGRVAAAAREAGFSRGYTTSATPLRPETDQLLIGRLVPPPSEDGFALTIMRTLGGS